ncbi:MAG: LysR family transcriptional regulator [Spirochaetales bacterium]|nr:LysR family transcriptional regulator [Spirochaetales bacterium]
MYTTLLDTKARAFLAVWEYRSFTKAAEALFITQPAVSQQMHALQQQMGTTLFVIEGRQVVFTVAGEELAALLAAHARNAHAYTHALTQRSHIEPLRFGATRTIGEFTLEPVLSSLMEQERYHCSLFIDNTEVLLQKIDRGEIDFAWIEGAFDKRRYEYRLYSHERFIAITSAEATIEGEISLQSLLESRLFIREHGSGTRAVLEGVLADRGLSLENFAHTTMIDNLNVIKALVGRGLGISFMYEAAARQELAGQTVQEIPIKGWHVVREFNFVFAQGSHHRDKYLEIWEQSLALATT